MAFYKGCVVALTLLSFIVAATFACEDDYASLEVAVNRTAVGTEAVANCSEEQFYCDGATTSGGKCLPLSWKCMGRPTAKTRRTSRRHVPRGQRVARSPKKKSTKKPRPSGGEGKHHVPCSVTCTNGGHTPTCCDAQGLSGGKCVGEKAFCT